MNLAPWWSLVTPRDDIQKSILDDSLFVADLGDVIAQRAPKAYMDAKTFFDISFITYSTKTILKTIFSRLISDQGGNPVIQLQSPFGGGKTHTMLMIYHSIKNLELLASFSELRCTALNEMIKKQIHPKIAVFVGTQYDVVREKTPWGIIAEQLGQYRLLEENDKKRIAPGKNLLIQLLTNVSPAIILIDELFPYITKYTAYETQNNILTSQILVFIQELTESVAAVPHTCLIMTFPQEELEFFDKPAEMILKKLKKLTGRIETIYSPVEKEDIPKIIRKRLFHQININEEIKNILKEYFNFYKEESNNFPVEVSELPYLRYMEECYPFHPEFINLLANQWSMFPYFQKIRGLLRILAKTINILGNLKIPTVLIHSSDIPLFDEKIRLECLNFLNPKVDIVIKTDLIGERALLNLITENLPLKSKQLAINIVNAIFMYSFTSNIAGLTIKQLNLCIFQPNVQLNVIDKILHEMQTTLWYLHKKDDRIYFDVETNINSLITQTMANISFNEIKESLKKLLYSAIGEHLSSFQLWIDQYTPADDLPSMKIGILSPEILYENDNSPKKEELKTIFTRTKKGIRINQNMLILLIADKNNFKILEGLQRKQIAIERIRTNSTYELEIDQESKTFLKTLISQTKDDLNYHILATYRHLIVNKNYEDILHCDLGIPNNNEHKKTLTSRIFKWLEESENILDELPIDYLLRKVFIKENTSISLEELWQLFTRIPSYPLLINRSILDRAILEGIKKNILKVKFDSKDISISDEAIFLNNSSQLLIEKISNMEPQQVNIIEEPQNGANDKKMLLIEAIIPNDQIDQFITGVIRPLQIESIKELVIKLKIEIAPNIVENNIINTIKETLYQIKAKINTLDENYSEENDKSKNKS